MGRILVQPPPCPPYSQFAIMISSLDLCLQTFWYVSTSLCSQYSARVENGVSSVTCKVWYISTVKAELRLRFGEVCWQVLYLQDPSVTCYIFSPTVSPPPSAFPTDSFHNSNVCWNEVTKYPEPTPSLELRQWSIYLCRIVNFALLHFDVDGREESDKI